MHEKDRRLLEYCARRACEGLWLRRRSNIAWAADGADVHCDSSSALGVASIVWTPARKRVLTNDIEAARLAREEFGPEWEIQAGPWWERGAEPEGNLARDWPEDCLCELRASLTPLELERVRALGSEVAEVFELAMKRVRPGSSELQFAGELSAALLERGIQAPVILAAAEERIALYRHPIPTQRRVERAFMGVLCASRHGLIVCLTRLVHFGPLRGDLARRHAAVRQVDAALHAATKPGARWCDVLATGIRAYAEYGFAEEWKLHHQGGPMGYECRDFLATPTETRRVAEQQHAGWNPSITGTKSEDTLLSTGETLTAMPDWPLAGGRPEILVRPSVLA
jgi:Xaa-Pro aminopeptidase